MSLSSTGNRLNILDYVHSVRTQIFMRNEIIFHQGDESNNTMYFTFEGSLSVIHNRLGDEKLITTLEPGDFFGEMALISNQTRTMTVRVTSSKAKLGLVDKAMFIKLAHTSPQFLYVLLKIAIERLTNAEKKQEELTGHIQKIKNYKETKNLK